MKGFPGGVRALDGVSLAIPDSAFFTLLGPSGCGKTTLLRLIGGFETQDEGSIHLHGNSLDRLPPWRRPVNTVFQSYAVFPHLTVARNIAFGLEMRRWKRTAIAARVAEMLSLVRLDGLGERRPAQLSGGQLRRVALARALAAAPRVLLLDEPLSALDLKLRMEMQLELKRLQAEVGITFVFVTHDQQEALVLSDQVAVMQAGRISQVGTPEDIYDRPANRFVAGFIGETNLLPAERVGPARFRLASGMDVDAAEPGPAQRDVTLAIRPERVRLVQPGATAIGGRVERLGYLGTDTTYHIALAGGLHLRAREQNRDAGKPRLNCGDTVAVALQVDSIRVLTE